MAKHIPCIDPAHDIFLVPDTSDGAYTNCECADCREARLADPDRIYFTAHEMADAWSEGWRAGSETTVRRLRDTLTAWLES